jgi:hypothetical protein
MSITISIKEVRKRAWHFLDPDTAGSAGMTLAQLQQFVAGTFHPSQEQLRRLARRMSVPEPCSND